MIDKTGFAVTISIMFCTCMPSISAAENCSDHDNWIKIPAGDYVSGSDRKERDFAYRIGSSAAKKNRWYDQWELPKETKFLPAYYISQYLTTQQQYAGFIKATDHRLPAISTGQYQQQGYLVHSYTAVKPYIWRNHGAGKAPYDERLSHHPVVLVSQADASTYCSWLGKQQNTRVNLPTEWQWEKAARGEDGRYYPWGNHYDDSRLNSEYRLRGTSAVDRFPAGASPYGVMDMAGNVFEWTRSRFDSSRITLKGGGSWDDSPGISRAASRHGRVAGAKHILFGFRCVCME